MTDIELTLEDLVAHDRWVRALAQRLVSDQATADDLAQEAWTAAIQKPPRSPGPTRAWMGRVVRNLHAMRVRADGRRKQREASAARGEALASVDALWEREQLRRRVAEAVFSLDEPYRSAILHRYFQDLKPREIAARLGLSSAAVETRLRRGREQLRDRLDREFGGRATWCTALLLLADLEGTTGGAGATGTAIAGGSAAIGPKLIGALAMGTKVKIVAALVVAACIAVVCWPERDPRDSNPPPRVEAERPAAAAPEVPSTVDRMKTPAAVLPPSSRPALAAAASDATPATGPSTASITGTVRDASGRAIEGAKLMMKYRDPNGDPWVLGAKPLERSTQTDAQGRYAFSGLAPDLDPYLHATARGYGEDRMHVRSGDRQDFVLLVAGRIEGTVVERDTRRPIADARVSAWPRSLRGRSSTTTQSTFSGADGRFVIDAVRPGLHGMTAVSPDHLSNHRRSVHVVVHRRCTTTVEIALSRGLRIRGRVLDRAGRPVVGATITDSGRTAKTGTDGGFLLGGAGRETRLRIDAPGKAPIKQWVRFLFRESTAGVAEREFRLLDAAILRGRIVGPDGVPVKDGAVRIKDSGPPTRADADGRFEVFIDTPGKARRMAVSAPGFASTMLPPFTLGAGETRDDLVVALTRGGVIEGRVATEKGAPVAGQIVMIKTWPRRSGRLDGVYRNTISGADGSYRFDALATGTYALTANGKTWPDKGGLTRGHRQGVRVEEGAVTRGIDLIPTARIRLTGRVLDQTDRPLAGVRISVASGPSRAWSDDEGRFTLEDIPARCPFRISVRKQEDPFQRKASRIPSSPTAASDELTLRMTRMPPGIRGRVVRADTGAPVTAFWIRLQSSSGRRSSSGRLRFRARPQRLYFQDSTGAFFLNANRRTGRYALDAGTDAGLVTAEPVAVTSGAEVEIVLPRTRLVPGGSARGRVLAPDGTPLDHARVTATDPSDGRMLGSGQSFTHADGIYRLTGLRAGSVLLQVKHDDWVARRTTIQVRAGTTAEQDLPLGAEGAVLHLQVRDVDGQPVAGARFLLFSRDGEAVHWDLRKYLALYRARFLQQGRRSFTDRDFRHELEQTAADGRVERRFTPPGDYVVEITRDGFEKGRRAVTIRLDAKNLVEIVLTRSK